MSEPEPWTLLFSRVKASMPGATEAMIRLEITAVMVDFTQETNLWMEAVPFVTQVGNLDYPLVIDKGVANRLICVYDAAQPPPVRWYSNGISMPVPGIIHFARDPNAVADLVALVAKACKTMALDGATPPKPTGYPDIDDWIVDKYSDTLYYGAISYLQSEPAKTFSNSKEAVLNGYRYRSGKSQAKVEAQRGQLYGGQSWMFPQGWSSIGRKGWA